MTRITLNNRRRSARPTLHDVASLCGVTPATVSRVLNGKKEFSTTAALRDKILQTAQKWDTFPTPRRES